MVPGSTDAVALISVDAARRVVDVTSDGAASGVAQTLLWGQIPVSGVSVENAREVETFDAAGSIVTVPAGSVSAGGETAVTWPSVAVTSPATASVAVTGVAIAASVGGATWLEYEQIMSVQSVVRTSDGAVRTEGFDYTLDLTRGLFMNVSDEALTLSYTASASRKDRISIDPRTVPAVPQITLGPSSVAQIPLGIHVVNPA